MLNNYQAEKLTASSHKLRTAIDTLLAVTATGVILGVVYILTQLAGT